MVIKGNARGGAGGLAKHLLRADTNERVNVAELRGVAARDLTDALHEMEAIGSGTRCRKSLYHASINTRADEHLTPAQKAHAIDTLEEKLGLTGQSRVVVEHLKEGRAHIHIVWSRIDLDTMTAISDSHNFRRHELVARNLEREFGHARVQGVHVERDGPDGDRVQRPDRTPSHAEMQQKGRNGFDPTAMRAEITDIWQRTDSGKAFVAALEEKGFLLCPGDRRDFVIVDRQGEIHSLARRIEGVTAKDVRTRMADVDREGLLSIKDARAVMRDVAQVERAEAKLKKRELNPLEQRVDRVLGRGLEGQEFRDALGEAGIILAKVTERDVQGFAAQRKDNELRLAIDPGHVMSRVPKVERDQIVAVTRRGNVYQLNPQRLDPDKLERAFGRSLPSVSEARDAWAFAREFVANHRADIQAERISRREAFEAGREQRVTARAAQRDTSAVLQTGEKAISKTVSIIARGIAALASAALGFLEGLFSARKPPTREQAKQNARAGAEADRQATFRAHVAEITQRQSSIVDQSRAQSRERDQEAHDRAVRERRQRDDGRSR